LLSVWALLGDDGIDGFLDAALMLIPALDLRLRLRNRSKETPLDVGLSSLVVLLCGVSTCCCLLSFKVLIIG
jgi:hypothetical protein